MTIEELEIIVDASIEPAINKIKKLMPQIRKEVTQAVEVAQNSMKNIDMKSVSNKIQQSMQLVKKKIDNIKKTNKSNEIAITINNKDAQKQISQIEKQIDSLQKKITSRQLKLDVINPQIDEIISNTRKDVTPDGVSSNDASLDSVVDNALSKNKSFKSLNNQAEKLYLEIEIYNKELDKAKTKVSRLKQEINQTATSQNKMTSVFSTFKGKLDQAKNTTKTLKNDFKQIPKITQNVTNNIKKMGINMKNSLGNVLKYAGALFSLRSIYNILSSSAQSWLSSQNAGAQQLSANIEYMKYAMGSVFAPVIEYVTNLVYKLMKAIQSLVYAFSGVNIFAKATAFSMNKTAGSASKASKSLAGIHNEINNVSENNNGGGTGSATPSMDLSQIDTSMTNWFDKWKEKLSKIFMPIKKAWNNQGQKTIDSAKDAIDKVKTSITTMGESWAIVWNNGTGQYTIELILQIFQNIFDIIGNIAEAWTNAWNSDGRGTELIQTMWNALNKLLDLIKVLTKKIKEFTSSPVVQEYFQNAIEMVTNFWKVLGGLLEFLTGVFTGDWKMAWTGLKDFVSGIFGLIWNVINEKLIMIKAIITNSLDSIKNLWSSIWEGIKTKALEIWDKLLTKIDEIFPGMRNIIETNVANIKNKITEVLNNIKNTWNNIWGGIKSKTSEIWNGIYNAIKGPINWILAGVEKMANGVVTGVNKVIRSLNNMNFTMPDWLGGGSFRVNLPTMSYVSLPRLAKGNVAYSETVAVFGEYAGASNNPEITAPQNIMRETFENVLANHEWNNQQTSNGELKQLVIQFGSSKVALEIERLLQQARRQNGTAYATI